MNALLLMNAQNSFLSEEGSVYLGEKAEILKVRLKDYVKGFKGKKIFFREKHAESDDFFVNDKTHSIATSFDFKIHESVKCYADIFCDKIRYSGFYKTKLDVIIKRNRITSVVLIGLETHTSILFTAEGLRNRGYDVTVVEPCTMARDDYMHFAAISLMKNFLGVKIE